MSIDKFLHDVKKEAEKAVKEHGDFNSLHEAAAIIFEEMQEAWEWVLKKESKRDYKKLNEEVIQIAAMCVKLHQFISNKL